MRKITIKDVLNEHELELMGITESVDGTPVSSELKVLEFLHDSGMYQSTEYHEIQARYRPKMSDVEERKKYFREITLFINEYFSKKVDEYLAVLNKKIAIKSPLCWWINWISSIMKITGHKTEREFLKYNRVTEEGNAILLLNHAYYSTPLKLVK